MFKPSLSKTIGKVVSFIEELNSGIANNNQVISNAVSEQERLDNIIYENEAEIITAQRFIKSLNG